MPSKEDNAPNLGWVHVALFAVLVLVLVFAVTFDILPQMGQGSLTFNETQNDSLGEVENRTTTTGNLSFGGLPADNGTVFMISSGDEPPPGWGYPAQIEMSQVNASTVHITTVYEREKFTVDLETGEKYHITAEQPNGRERDLGILRYTNETNEPVHIIVG